MAEQRAVTDLEKRLICAMDLGITVQHMDGHRYILCTDYDRDFVASCQQAGISFSGKVYGSLLDALDRIDFLLKKMNRPTLIERFDANRHNTYDDDNLFTKHEDEKDHERSLGGVGFDPHFMK